MSLQGHGLQNGLRAAEILKTRGADVDNIVSGRFFLDPADEELWKSYAAEFAHKTQSVVADADRICRHEFDLLGSGVVSLGHPIDWHLDPGSGYRWARKFFWELQRNGPPPRADIKFPWELSRMQHLPTLGKAYRLTKNPRYAGEVIEQVIHWIEDNPCGYGVNWMCAMDVAIRAMNVTCAYAFIRDAAMGTRAFRARLAQSLYEHAQFILFNLEFGLREDGAIVNGNHYLSNIVGLLHLGLICPELKGAEAWKSIGLKAVIEEMDRQVYPDGANFESSTSYHRLVLELFTTAALMCKANGTPLPAPFWRRLERMFEFVLSVARPDGHMPMVGDADDGRVYILSDYGDWDRTDFRYLLSVGAILFGRSDMKAQVETFSEEAFWLLGPEGSRAFAGLPQVDAELKSTAFSDAGLYVMRHRDHYLLACCGGIGAGHHKHNDSLSFELYAGDKPFIIDPGTYVYTRDMQWRNRFRSTAYHNTAVIDDREQNRFVPNQPFKLTSDSKVVVHEWSSTTEFDCLDAEHFSYDGSHLPFRHRRRFLFNKHALEWEITDALFGSGGHHVDWYFHLDHGIDLEWCDERRVKMQCGRTVVEMRIKAELPFSVETIDGWISRKYGEKLPAKILHISGIFRETGRVSFNLSAKVWPKLIRLFSVKSDEPSPSVHEI